MLKLFWRHGIFYRLLTGLAWLLWLVNLLDVVMLGRYEWNTQVFFVFGFLAVILEMMALIPWYRGGHRGSGIEEHFEHTAVPMIYLFLTGNVLRVIDLPVIGFEVTAAGFFLLFLAFNLVLLVYHFRDEDTTPPAWFSKNLFLHVD